MKRITSAFLFSVLLLTFFFEQQIMPSLGSTTINVYPGESIQAAINSANPGDTVFVHAGFYPEILVVNKSLSLVGEGRDITTIDGNNTFGNVVYIVASYVTVTGFTIQNARGFSYYDINPGILIDGNSSGCTISNNTIRDNYGGGIYQEKWLYPTRLSNHTITGNIIINNFGGGIIILNGDNNVITDNKVENNTAGFYLDRSSYNIVARNSIVGQGFDQGTYSGIELEMGVGNMISENNVSNSYFGISERGLNDTILKNNITNNENGIWLIGGSYSNIFENNISDNSNGFNIDASDDNRIHENTITDNGNGILLWLYSYQNGGSNAINNTFYRNNFINNGLPVLFQGTPSNVNYWDNGFEGNYWSNYALMYPDAAEIDSSGVWNTPYVLDQNNRDNYPLVRRFALDAIPPHLSVLSPENETYATTDLQLTFTVDESVSWKAYSLDGVNITVLGNTTLIGLSEGAHNLTIFARDLSGNIASSNTVIFTVAVIPEFSCIFELIFLFFVALPITLYIKRKSFPENPFSLRA